MRLSVLGEKTDKVKILLTGASGLVGSAFASAALRSKHQLVALYHKNPIHCAQTCKTVQLDLSDTEALKHLALDVLPDVIVNAAAISSPADVDLNPKEAAKINVRLPHQLALLTKHLRARFLHLSTDMVFDGKRGSYSPEDTPAPANLYGRQKRAAEKVILEDAAERSTILRITIVTGNSPRGQRSVHEKLFQLWSSGRKATLFTDEIRQPCSAENVADVLLELCEREDLVGIFHWAGADALSRHEMGQRILEKFSLPPDLIEPVSLHDQDAGQHRPANLTLNIDPLAEELKTKPTSFSQQLKTLEVPPPCRDWLNSQ